nr:hypothetical protein GCM10020093_040790 [Planobispora longispora]
MTLAGRARRPDVSGGAPGEPLPARLRRHALPVTAVAVAALPSVANAATGRVTWIGAETPPGAYGALLGPTGLEIVWIFADLLVGIGLMAVVVAFAVRGGRRAPRVAASALAAVAVIGVLSAEPFPGVMAPDVEQPLMPTDDSRLEELHTGILEGAIRLVPSADVGVSPAWFSLAYGIAAVLVLLHARPTAGPVTRRS